MNPIIRVENVGKMYRPGAHRRTAHTTLRAAIAGALRAPFNACRRRGETTTGTRA